MRMLRLASTSDLAQIPMWIPHSAVAVGFALMVLVVLRRGIGLLRVLLAAEPRAGSSARTDATP